MIENIEQKLKVDLKNPKILKAEKSKSKLEEHIQITKKLRENAKEKGAQMPKTYYASIKKIDIANGVGVRVSFFVSGCRIGCKGCFNEIAWNFKYGKEFSDETLQELYEDLNHPFIAGLSILGGEPLDPNNQETISKIVTFVKEKFPEKNIWLYSGYYFKTEIYPEYIKEKGDKSPLTTIIDNIDVLVDGRFDYTKLDKNLRFRGSSNQSIIDVKKTLKNGKIELLNFEY